MPYNGTSTSRSSSRSRSSSSSSSCSSPGNERRGRDGLSGRPVTAYLSSRRTVRRSLDTIRRRVPVRLSVVRLVPILAPARSVNGGKKTNPTLKQTSGAQGENEMVGRQKVVTDRKTGKTPDKPGPARDSTRATKVRNGFISKRKYASKNTQTGTPEIDLITGENPDLIYWRELSESRRVSLEEALEENKNLIEQVKKLEEENRILEDMLEEAKSLAEMISNLSDDDDNDESGIGPDYDDTENS